jgi:pyruvate/2-oxoglutarate dehydrogenase complex dihydrolipoamide acyltransferase (E2) component
MPAARKIVLTSFPSHPAAARRVPLVHGVLAGQKPEFDMWIATARRCTAEATVLAKLAATTPWMTVHVVDDDPASQTASAEAWKHAWTHGVGEGLYLVLPADVTWISPGFCAAMFQEQDKFTCATWATVVESKDAWSEQSEGAEDYSHAGYGRPLYSYAVSDRVLSDRVPSDALIMNDWCRFEGRMNLTVGRATCTRLSLDSPDKLAEPAATEPEAEPAAEPAAEPVATEPVEPASEPKTPDDQTLVPAARPPAAPRKPRASRKKNVTVVS